MSRGMLFRKKPVVIEVMKWDGTSKGASVIIEWVNQHPGRFANYTCDDPDDCAKRQGGSPHTIRIKTLEGTMHASPGDYVIKGVKGEFYPCKPDIFEETYEAVYPPPEEAV